MRLFAAFVIFTSLASIAPAIHAESHNPSDYPLRVHIYRRNETTFYQNRQAQEAKGEGRANLFEGGQPKGIDFQFECDTSCRPRPVSKPFLPNGRSPGRNSSSFSRSSARTVTTPASSRSWSRTSSTSHATATSPANQPKSSGSGWSNTSTTRNTAKIHPPRCPPPRQTQQPPPRPTATPHLLNPQRHPSSKARRQ